MPTVIIALNMRKLVDMGLTKDYEETITMEETSAKVRRLIDLLKAFGIHSAILVYSEIPTFEEEEFMRRIVKEKLIRDYRIPEKDIHVLVFHYPTGKWLFEKEGIFGLGILRRY
jgi:hypothetical protein